MIVRPILTDRGFSLLEILVGLAVTGLIVTAMTSVTGIVLRREAFHTRLSTQQESLMAAERLFRSLVSRAVPNVRTGYAAIGFVGTSSDLNFLSLGPESLMFDQPEPLSLRAEGADDDKRLMLRWTDPNSGIEREEIVLSGAGRISLSYFDHQQGRARAWQAEWIDPLVLPLAVSLQIELPALGPPIDIVVRTRAALPNICRALPHEPYCQEEINR